MGYDSNEISVHAFDSQKFIGNVPVEKKTAFAWVSENDLVSSPTEGILRISRVSNAGVKVQRELQLPVKESVHVVTTSSSNKKVAVSYAGGKLTCFDTQSWQPFSERVIGVPSSLSINDAGTVAAAVEGKAYLVDVEGVKRELGSGSVVAFSPSGSLVAVGDDQRYLVVVYVVETGSPVCTLAAHQSPIWALVFVTESELLSSEFANTCGHGTSQVH
jgi:WD40 repeat protein